MEAAERQPLLCDKEARVSLSRGRQSVVLLPENIRKTKNLPTKVDSIGEG